MSMVRQSAAKRQLHRLGYGQEQSEDVSRGSDCDEAEASGTDHLVTSSCQSPPYWLFAGFGPLF